MAETKQLVLAEASDEALQEALGDLFPEYEGYAFEPNEPEGGLLISYDGRQPSSSWAFAEQDLELVRSFAAGGIRGPIAVTIEEV